MLKLVGFDLDDTLIDDVAATREGVSRLAGAWGATDLQQLVGAWQEASQFHFEQYINGLESLELNRIRRVQDVARAFGTPLDEKTAGYFFSVYRAGYEAGWQCFNDTIPVISSLLSKGLTLGILTNGDGPTQRAKIQATGLSDWFSLVVISGEVGRAKPDPSIFEYLLERANACAEAAFFVGDRMDKDVIPARTVGMHAMHLDRSQGQTLADIYPQLRKIDTRF